MHVVLRVTGCVLTASGRTNACATLCANKSTSLCIPGPRNIPYGFHHFSLPSATPGFPVWLDINLSQDGAQAWLTWLRDALLLDDTTAGITARVATYNADLRIFALSQVTYEFGAGGSIQVRSRASSRDDTGALTTAGRGVFCRQLTVSGGAYNPHGIRLRLLLTGQQSHFPNSYGAV